MAPPTEGRKSKPKGRPKNDTRSLKRKRDVDDLENLQKAVEELVSTIAQDQAPQLILRRISKQR